MQHSHRLHPRHRSQVSHSRLKRRARRIADKLALSMSRAVKIAARDDR